MTHPVPLPHVLTDKDVTIVSSWDPDMLKNNNTEESKVKIFALLVLKLLSLV